MNLYSAITMAMILLAAIIANIDSHRRLQVFLAVIVYVLLAVLLILEILYKE